MKNFVRTLSLLLSLIMIFALAACSGSDAEGEYWINGDSAADIDVFYPSSGDAAYGYSGNKSDVAGPADEGYLPSEEADAEASGDHAVPPTSGEANDVENTTTAEDTSNPLPDDGKEPAYANDLIAAPFTDTEENNFSTFSADVDTASYTYFRKLINMGYGFSELSRNGMLFRTEEFINYFKYDIGQPKEGELFGVYTEMAACPWNSNSMILRLTLQAPRAEKSAGNNLVFLIDVSGSMSSPDKLPLLKKAFSYLVGNLSPADTISIVTYSGREAVVLDGCRGGDTGAIMHAINTLEASGSTNGEAGLTMAYRLAEKHFIAGGNNRIIMASDGDLNVGISTASELTKYIEEKRDEGVYLSVLGFGTGNYRDDRMEALADNGNGVYYYIDGESEAEKVFGTDLMGTLYTVADDVKLQIEFNKETVKSYRLIGYDNRLLSKEDFENDMKDAGEVGASHQVTVVYEIMLNTPELDTGIELPQDYLTFRVRYKDPGEPISKLNEYHIGSEAINAQATLETRFILSVIETAALLRNTAYAGDITIQTVAQQLEQMELSKSEMIEFCELISKLAK